MNVYEKLQRVQEDLKAPKSQTNTFGKYKYRSTEDILEALKPLLSENKLAITITDNVEQIGDRFYVVATVEIINTEKSDERVQVQARAREDVMKKGMDLSQLTGATSSYARKYALNGMFAIDDTKDSDTTNTHGKEPSHTINKAQADTLDVMAKQIKADLSKTFDHYGVDRAEELTVSQFTSIIKLMKRKKDELEKKVK